MTDAAVDQTQDDRATPAPVSFRRFDHVGISVVDLEAAAAWYEQAFDLVIETRFSIPNTDMRGMMLVHDAGYRVELLERKTSVPGIQADHPDVAALTRGYGHMCFCVEDVDAAFAQLVAAGAQPRLQPRPSSRPGARFAWVADLDGNLIEMLDRNS